MGINPLLLNKLLPPVLGCSPPATVWCLFEMLPLPGAGFTATLLLNQIIWMKDEFLPHPERLRIRCFSIFCTIVATLLAWECCGDHTLRTILSHYVFVSAGILILRLFPLENGRLRLSQNQSDYLLCAWTRLLCWYCCLCLEIL